MISVFRKHTQPPARLTFDAFEIDLRDSVLRKNGEPVPIGRQAFRALALLVSKGGDLVTREELQKAIWGDRVHVDFEPGLNVCIRKVRAALGDVAEGSRIVVTCPREGYRLGVPVKRAGDVRHFSLHVWGAAAALLALVGGGYLLARTSISGHEATSTVSRPGPTRSFEAYAWYWRGRGYADRTTGSKPFGAIPFFEKAAALDSTFALAQVGLAVAYMDRGAEGIAPVESAIRARAAAHRALVLDARSAETHVALAELSYRLDDDDLNAQREFVRAVELDG